MYIMGGRELMTPENMQFLREVGIDPSSLDDPSPSPLPPPPPSEAPIPKLAEKDARWLQNLGVVWSESEPEFIPPGTLVEYLKRYPNGIREAVCVGAMELGITLLVGGVDDLAKDITQMFLDFDALGFEDVIAMYVTFRPIRPLEDMSEHFHSYVEMRVRAALPVVLGNTGAVGR
jgi:hypothetical protein